MPAGNVDITVTFFTDEPIQGPLPEGAITLPDYDVIAPFLLGDTIMKQTVSYPLTENGTLQFDIDIPEHTATFSVKVSYNPF